MISKFFVLFLMVFITAGYTGSSCGYGDAVVDEEKFDESLATATFTVALGDGEMSITWDEVANATSYNIHVESIARNIKDTPILTKVTSQPQLVKNLENGKEYFVVVQSVGEDGRFSKIPSEKKGFKPNSLFVQMANGDVSSTTEQKDTIKALKQIVGKSVSLTNRDENLEAYNLLKERAQISLVNKNIVDIAPLASFKKISSLDLSTNKIADLSPLESLEELQVLVLQKNRFSDLSVILKLEKLTELDVSFNDGINFESVKINLSTLASDTTQDVTLKNFRVFKAVKCEIEDLTDIAWLDDLEQLDLNGNKILSLSPLINWQNLKTLDVAGNPSNLKNDGSYQTLRDRIVNAGGAFLGVGN